ncbi:hypothetical protein FG386_002478 [Cryptosporidium ryanae]|uniref:uncharacterized protein n=1 Tax=Cryptosporidium ryanae TaxID=515981 RepID=UPI00351A9226|nr:hypothetical protein FG386_002478 [Cryptosporidium ryanae]
MQDYMDLETVVNDNDRNGGKDKNKNVSTVKGYIRELLIDNFKSYKGKHIIGPFSENLTCIVGPNGSGKSNLMDALSFALGLSSNDMRSTNLKELIYRPEQEDSTQISNDKSQNSSNMDIVNCSNSNIQTEDSSKIERNAEVSILFVPYDSDIEVKFCRRILSSGTSRYMINEDVVSQDAYFKRLADFNVLIKARNFLVFQGDVEDVAQRAPRELTSLFEKISGSDTYTEEYDRLSNEQCVNQIISHNSFNRRKLLEAEKRELQKQVEEVNEYEGLLEQKMKIQTEDILFKLYCNEVLGGKLFEERNKIDEKIKLTNDNIESQKKKIKEDESRLAKDNLDFKKLNSELENLEQEEITSKNLKLKLEKNNKDYIIEIRKQNKQKELILMNISKNEKLLNEYMSQMEMIKKELNEICNSSDSSEFLKAISSDIQEYIECKKKADMASSELREKLVQIEREQKNKYSIIEIIEKEKIEIQNQITSIKAILESMNEKLSEQEEKLKITIESESSLNAEFNNIEKEFNGIGVKVASLVKERNKYNDDIKSIDAKNNEVKNELNSRKLIEDLRNSINNSSNINSECYHVYGRLSDLCHSNNKQFSTAIDSALGKYNEYIVVSTWQTAKECINWLKSNKKQPMNFIPLNSIIRKSNHEYDTKLRSLCAGNKSVRSLAKDNIHVSDDGILPALDFCLNGIIITHDLEDAKKIFYIEAPKLNIKPKVITLDGEKILKNGSFSMDSMNIRANSKSFAKEYANLNSKIEILNEKISNLEEIESDGSRKLSRLRDNLKRIELDKKAINTKMNIYNNNINEKLKLLELLEKKLKEKDDELSNETLILNSLNNEIEKAKIAINESDVKHFEKLSKKLNIEDISLLEQESRRKHDELLQKKNKLSSRLNIIQEEYDCILKKDKSMREKLDEKEGELDKYQKLINEGNNEIELINNEFKKIENKIKDLKQSLKSINEFKNEYQKDMDKKKRGLMDLQESLSGLTIEKTNKSNDLEVLNNELISLLKSIVFDNIKVPLLSGGYDDIKRYWEYFESTNNKNVKDTNELEEPPLIQIDYGDLTNKQKSYSDSEEKIKNEIARLSKLINDITDKIESLSPNMKSKERIKEVDAQLTALLEDQREIRKKSMEIDRSFKDLRKKRTQVFMKCFEAVKEAVSDFYSQLTCEDGNIGGQAFLDLDDTNLEEPFACGIIFHAMPPSKRFRDIQQLSGGEKTMAALALLFAMQSYHPSPFFVLDEVDAALDPKNVQSIARFLKEASFQSIVISLKDRFFSQADTLIGVYKDKEIHTSAIMTLDLTRYSSNKGGRNSLSNKENNAINYAISSRSIDYDIFDQTSSNGDKDSALRKNTPTISVNDNINNNNNNSNRSREFEII